MLYKRSKYERGSSPFGGGLVRESTKRRGGADAGGIDGVPALSLVEAVMLCLIQYKVIQYKVSQQSRVFLLALAETS